MTKMAFSSKQARFSQKMNCPTLPDLSVITIEFKIEARYLTHKNKPWDYILPIENYYLTGVNKITNIKTVYIDRPQTEAILTLAI